MVRNLSWERRAALALTAAGVWWAANTGLIQARDLGSQKQEERVNSGYWWEGRFWVPYLISEDKWRQEAPNWIRGGAVFYAQGIMERVAEARGYDLSGYVDGVAMLSPSEIGQKIWMRKSTKDEWEGPFLVVDCAARKDMYPLVIYNQEMAELGFETAKRWGMVDEQDNVEKWRLNGVEISKTEPENLKGTAVDYQSWWEGARDRQKGPKDHDERRRRRLELP